MLLSDLPALSATRLIAGSLASLAIYLLGRVLYNIFLHPLRAYPGPKVWAASRLPWIITSLRGDLAWSLLALHERYGPVVRIAPDELSYTGAGDAWKKIYGRRGPDEFVKCLDGRAIAGSNIRATAANGIISAPHDKHARLRRAVAPAFSERALREQEDCLQLYTGKLMEQLRRCCRDVGSGPQDMQRWYSLFAFDVMSDLAFGQAVGCLDNVDQPWLQVLGARTKSIVWYQVLIYYGLDRWAKYFTPASLMAVRQKHVAMTSAKVQKRLQQKEDRKDFISYLLQNKTETLTNRELVMMASSFIVAGSGTSSAALAGITYLLCKNPDKYKNLCDEVRSAFTSEAEITLESTSRLSYLKAAIEEGLRLYPPSPSTFPRFVPPGKGEEIEGQWVPGGAAVGVHQFSAGRMEHNFKDAISFIPERWLPLSQGAEFVNDNRAAMQPFSYGPRNCIGVNMAYAEMRLVLARLLWNFDIELLDDQWMAKQKTWLVWHKIPLPINLKSVKAM
ncbi:Cytochrome P450 monooxygenase alt3 [Apiospora saccharicola]